MIKRITAQQCDDRAENSNKSTWPSSIACSLRILRDGFDSALEPIAFGMHTKWLLTGRVQAHSAVSFNLLKFLFNII